MGLLVSIGSWQAMISGVQDLMRILYAVRTLRVTLLLALVLGSAITPSLRQDRADPRLDDSIDDTARHFLRVGHNN